MVTVQGAGDRRSRSGLAGSQVALVQLPMVDANRAIKVGKLHIGRSECPLGIREPLDSCALNQHPSRGTVKALPEASFVGVKAIRRKTAQTLPST